MHLLLSIACLRVSNAVWTNPQRPLMYANVVTARLPMYRSASYRRFQPGNCWRVDAFITDLWAGVALLQDCLVRARRAVALAAISIAYPNMPNANLAIKSDGASTLMHRPAAHLSHGFPWEYLVNYDCTLLNTDL
jgi:hypothetical protein